MQQLAPVEYRSLREFVSGEGDVVTQTETRMQRYGWDYEYALDEAVADYVGRMVQDGQVLEEFIRKHENQPKGLKKLWEIIKDIARKLTGAEKRQAETAADRLEEAYLAAESKAAELQKKNAPEGVDSKNSLKDELYAGKSLTEDASVYSYDFLTDLPDMTVTVLPELNVVQSNGKVDTGKVVSAGMENARNVGAEQDGKVFVRNAYTNRPLRIDTASIRHGLNGNMYRLKTNARLGAVIGDVVQNAVPINALNNKAQGVTGTYAMAAYATDSDGREVVAIVTVEQRDGNVSGIETYDVAHAVSGRQKNSSQADTKSQGVYPIKAATISIADLLRVVNSTHQSILSDDVLRHFGETRNPDGDYTGQVRYSMKDSDGNELTQAQQEYFRDSKVRDAEGNLLVMYQGGEGDFTVFERAKSKYSNLYGRGFYFTNSESHAKQYGKARAFYLNITSPVSTTETTITKAQLRAFLEAVAENEGDFSFENYGYGATVDSVLESVWGKSDFAMLNDVNQTAIGDLVAAAELFNDVNGTDFDGFILDTETVVFSSEQVKNTDNRNPTADKDIRYSIKGDEMTKERSAMLRAELEQVRKQAEEQNWTATQRDAEIAKAAERVYQRYNEMYGIFPPGENPARDVSVPRRTGEKWKVSQKVPSTITHVDGTLDSYVTAAALRRRRAAAPSPFPGCCGGSPGSGA